MEQENIKKPEENTASMGKGFWVIGAVILILFGLFAAKILLFPTENFKLTLVDAPKSIQAGGVATFTWRIDGPPTNIVHTAVYLGKESVPGEISQTTYPADLEKQYTDSVKDFMFGKYAIPLVFIGNVKLDSPGQYYFRVHASIKDKNYWSEEDVLEVK